MTAIGRHHPRRSATRRLHEGESARSRQGQSTTRANSTTPIQLLTEYEGPSRASRPSLTARREFGEMRDGRRPRGRTCIRVWACTGASAGVVTPFVREGSRRAAVMASTSRLPCCAGDSDGVPSGLPADLGVVGPERQSTDADYGAVRRPYRERAAASTSPRQPWAQQSALALPGPRESRRGHLGELRTEATARHGWQ